VRASAPGVAGKLPSEEPEVRPSSARGWPLETIMTSHTKHASAGRRHSRDDGGDRGDRGDGSDGGTVGVIPYLVVLVCTVAGLYIAWRQGSAGGGRGAVVGGVALLVAALLRLAIPARLVGLLGTRKRATDVLTLTVLGAGLIVAGLVLPAALGPGRLVRGGVRRFPSPEGGGILTSRRNLQSRSWQHDGRDHLHQD
jgi:Protein of unknown function (DUF3017)